MKTKSYVYCDYHLCRAKESCQRYMPTLERKYVDHIDPVPYNEEKGKCNYYLKDDEDADKNN